MSAIARLWIGSRSAVCLVLLGLGAAIPWALSSPPGASPDDDFHLQSAWCAGGTTAGVCDTGETPDARSVPLALVHVADCYRFDAAVSASCQSRTLDWDDETMVSSERLNTKGLYPPVFYRSMNLLVSNSPIESIVAMRLLTIVLAISVLGLVFWSSPAWLRQALAGSWLLALFPLGAFLVTSNNPSAWAMIGVGTFWATLVNLLENSEPPPQWMHGGLAVLTAGIAAGSRADAAVYILISVLAVFIATGRWRLLLPRSARGSNWLVPTVVAIVCVMALASFLSSSQGEVATAGFSGGPARTTSYLLEYNLRHLHVLHLGMIGISWGLGWLDTPMPEFVGETVGYVTVAAVAWGLTRTDRKKAVSVALLTFAMIAIPVAILVRSSYVVPEAVQPRYLYPLYFVLLALTMLPSDREPRALPLPVRLVGAVAFAAVNAVALHVNFRRYLTGLDVDGFDLNADHEWWWAGVPPPMVLWSVSVVSVFALALSITWLFRDDAGSRQRATDSEVASV